jgi:WD40 repeat protein/tRNA A-37 threonylcarbamoyl transferase component Bud32
MPEIVTHPSAQALALFSSGKLSEAKAVTVATHLETCSDCRGAVERVPPDSFLGKVRAAKPGGTVLPASTGRPSGASVAGSSGPAVPVPDLPPELVNHPKFRVVRELGRGGMGVIYLAEHRVMDKPVALKVISASVLDNPTAVARFLSEVRAAGKLDHPNIARAHDADRAGELHFLVMEYVEGISLAQVLEKRGPLPVAHACHYVRQAALGLQHAFEKGMVHRDIKPQNLMLTPKGVVKVLDFGLARVRDERKKVAPRLTRLESFMGTPTYVAPEQATDAREADTRSDIYSLGCTLYALLAGRPPFVGDSLTEIVMAHIEKEARPLHELRPDVPAGLTAVVAKMLAKAPAQRFQRPVEVAQALAPFIRKAKSPEHRDPAPAELAIAPDPFAFTTGVAPVPRRRPGSRATDHRRRRFVIAAAVPFLLAGLLGAAVYRIATDQGELVITTESDDVQVVITQGGKIVDVIDTKTDKQIRLALRSGEYELALKDGQEGLRLSPGNMTLKRGETKLATIRRVPLNPVPPAQVGEIRRFGTTPGHNIRGLALSLDGKHLLTGSTDTFARYWDITTGKEIYQLPSKGGQVYGVAISPDGTKLLSCGGDRLIHVWDAATGQELKHLTGHTDEVLRVAISPDGRMVASAGYDCQLRLWNLDTGKLIASPGKINSNPSRDWYAGGGEGAAFSPDGKLIATWAQDHIVRLWDVKTLKEIRRLEGHKEWVVAAAFSRDGSRLLSGTWPSDGRGAVDRPSELKLWEVRTGKLLHTFDLPQGDNVCGLAISPDGRRALSCGGACLVRLWDLERGKEIIALKGHVSLLDTDPVTVHPVRKGWVSGVAFLPDGRTAVSVGDDFTIRLWRLPDPPPVKENP